PLRDHHADSRRRVRRLGHAGRHAAADHRRSSVGHVGALPAAQTGGRSVTRFALALLLATSPSAAQKAATPSTKAAPKAPPAAKTTWSGVYTTAQAARGRRV